MNSTTRKEHFTGAQALGLLWVEQKDSKVKLELTQEELRHLQIIVLDEFDFLDTPYKKNLVSQVKVEILTLMLKEEPIFK